MSTRQTTTLGNRRFRVGPWHSDPRIAYLTLVPDVTRPTAEDVRSAVRGVTDEQYRSIITSALHPEEARPFLHAGFEEYDRLRVLSHDLSDLHRLRPTGADGRRPSASIRLRRARARDRDRALEVDGRAFPPFWRLDRIGLEEAITATPRSRFRVAEIDGSVIGYAVAGRATDQGFLQRLATDPDRMGAGVGSSLVIDALRWAARRRVTRMLVNTQDDNRRALDLYQRLGFDLTPTDLVVLARPLP